MRTDTLERAVLKKIIDDLKSTKFAQRLVQSARTIAEPHVEADTMARAYADIERFDTNIAKVTALLSDGPQRPLPEQIGKWEAEREKIRAGIIGMERGCSRRVRWLGLPKLTS